MSNQTVLFVGDPTNGYPAGTPARTSYFSAHRKMDHSSSDSSRSAWLEFVCLGDTKKDTQVISAGYENAPLK